MTKKIQVLLLTDIRWVWQRGEVVSASPAYAQNVLIPQGKAKLADKGAINQMEQQKAKKIEEHKKQLEEYKELFEEISKAGGLKFTKQATPSDRLYDKIDEKYLLNHFLTSNKIKFAKWTFKMKDPIDKIGEHEIDVIIEDMKTKLKITVIKG